MRVRRLGDGPIVEPSSHPSIGTNIQGPSLIRVPDWVPDPLGRYYLYFADHKGSYIRLAYADAIEGPWIIHAPGSLQLADSTFLAEPPEASPEQLATFKDVLNTMFGEGEWAPDLVVDATTPHIASPDVHVDNENERIVMYFHGLASLGRQLTKVATSGDGINFEGLPEPLSHPYLRAFNFAGQTYALTMPGVMYRSADGFSNFEAGPNLFVPTMRHSAVVVRDETLHVLWTRVGDAPESILHSTIELTGDWSHWKASEPGRVLWPEHEWEGADATAEPSMRSVAYGHVNQLRDPAIFAEGGRTFLLYAVAGESGIALAEIDWDD